MIIKLTKKELLDIVVEARKNSFIPSNDVDEMAIPTYLHSNILIKWLFWRRFQSICELGRLEDINQVLDFGCGIGVLLPTLCSKVKGSVHASDLYPQFAKELTNKRNLKVNFHTSDLEFKDIPNHSLDLIIAADSLEHIHNVEDYLKLFQKKLTAEGRLIISGPTENIIYRLGRVIAGFGNKGHYHLTNIHDLSKNIQGMGYELIRSRSLPFQIPPYLFKVLEFKVKNN
jgi:2-polyprenyl-3-methyl-5-hydroxy-6-metoxy-1,4-benzoquinol methylase